MPQPKTTPTNLRPDLVGAMEAFPIAMAMAGMIAYEVAPIIDVSVQSDQFAKIPVEAILRPIPTQRHSQSNYHRDDFEFELDSFATKEHGGEALVDDRDAAKYASYFDAELVATQRKRLQIMLAAEKRVADLVFNAATFTGDYTKGVSNEWNDYSNATPIDDVEAAVQQFHENCGLWPNRLVMSRLTFRHLRNCEQIIERVSSMGAGDRSLATDLNPAKIAEVFDLPKILVGGMSTNTADKGQAAAISAIWNPDYAMLAYVDESGDIQAPSLAKTFHWSEDGSTVGGTVESYREDGKRSTVIRVRHETDEKLTMPKLGLLLTGLTT